MPSLSTRKKEESELDKALRRIAERSSRRVASTEAKLAQSRQREGRSLEAIGQSLAGAGKAISAGIVQKERFRREDERQSESVRLREEALAAQGQRDQATAEHREAQRAQAEASAEALEKEREFDRHVALGETPEYDPQVVHSIRKVKSAISTIKLGVSEGTVSPEEAQPQIQELMVQLEDLEEEKEATVQWVQTKPPTTRGHYLKEDSEGNLVNQVILRPDGVEPVLITLDPEGKERITKLSLLEPEKSEEEDELSPEDIAKIRDEVIQDHKNDPRNPDQTPLTEEQIQRRMQKRLDQIASDKAMFTGPDATGFQGPPAPPPLPEPDDPSFIDKVSSFFGGLLDGKGTEAAASEPILPPKPEAEAPPVTLSGTAGTVDAASSVLPPEAQAILEAATGAYEKAVESGTEKEKAERLRELQLVLSKLGLAQ